MLKEIKVAIVEDQQRTREGLAALIGGTPGYRIVGSFASMEDALAKLEREFPDVLLADIGLPGISGIEGVRRLKARYQALQVLMLTVYADDEHINDCFYGIFICSSTTAHNYTIVRA